MKASLAMPRQDAMEAMPASPEWLKARPSETTGRFDVRESPNG
jgi:hypothetical protein